MVGNHWSSFLLFSFVNVALKRMQVVEHLNKKVKKLRTGFGLLKRISVKQSALLILGFCTGVFLTTLSLKRCQLAFYLDQQLMAINIEKDQSPSCTGKFRYRYFNAVKKVKKLS